MGKFLLALVCLAFCLLTEAADEEDAKPTHRVDFGLSWFDTPGETTINGGLYYAWAPAPRSGLAKMSKYIMDGVWEGFTPPPLPKE